MSFSRAPIRTSAANSDRSQRTQSPFKNCQVSPFRRCYVNSGYGNSVCGTQSDATPSAITSEWTEEETLRTSGREKEKKKHVKNSRNLSTTSSMVSGESASRAGGGIVESEIVEGLHSFIAEQSLKIAALEKESSILSSYGGQQGTANMTGITCYELAQLMEVQPLLLEIQQLLSSCTEEEGEGKTQTEDEGKDPHKKKGLAHSPNTSVKSSSAKQNRKQKKEHVPLNQLFQELKETACLGRSKIVSLKQKNTEYARIIEALEREVAGYRQNASTPFPSTSGSARHDDHDKIHRTKKEGNGSEGSSSTSPAMDNSESNEEREPRGAPVFRLPSLVELQELQSRLEEWQQAHRTATNTVQRLTSDLHQLRQENESLVEQLKREQKKKDAMRALYEKEIAVAFAARALPPSTGLEGSRDHSPSSSDVGARSASSTSGAGSGEKKGAAHSAVYHHLFRGREYVLAYQSDVEAFRRALEEDLLGALSSLRHSSNTKFCISVHTEVRSVMVDIEIPSLSHNKKKEVEFQLMDYCYPQVEKLAGQIVRRHMSLEKMTPGTGDASPSLLKDTPRGKGKVSPTNNHQNVSGTFEINREQNSALAVLRQELQRERDLLAAREKEVELLRQRYGQWIKEQKRDAAEYDGLISQVLSESENKIEELQEGLKKKQAECATLTEKIRALKQKYDEQQRQLQERSSAEEGYHTTSEMVIQLQMEVTALIEERDALREALQHGSPTFAGSEREGEGGQPRGSRQVVTPHRKSSGIRTFTEVFDCILPLSSVEVAEQLSDMMEQSSSHNDTLRALLLHIFAMRAEAIPLGIRRCVVESREEGQMAVRVRVELGFTCLEEEQEMMSRTLRAQIDQYSTERAPVLENYLTVLKDWKYSLHPVSDNGSFGSASPWGSMRHSVDGQKDSQKKSQRLSTSLRFRGRFSISENKELTDLLEYVLTVGERLSSPELADQLTIVQRKYREMEELVKKNRNDLLQLSHKYRGKEAEVDRLRQSGDAASEEATSMKQKDLLSSQVREIQRLQQDLEVAKEREKKQSELLHDQNHLLEALHQQLQACTSKGGNSPDAAFSASTKSTTANENGVIHRLETLLSNAETEKQHLSKKVLQLERDLEDLVAVQRSLQDGMENAQRSNREAQIENEELKIRIAEKEEEWKKMVAEKVGEGGNRNTNRFSFASFSFSSFLPAPNASSSQASRPPNTSSSVSPVKVVKDSIHLLQDILVKTSHTCDNEKSRVIPSYTYRVHPSSSHDSSVNTALCGGSQSESNATANAEEEETDDMLLAQLLSLIQEVGVRLDAAGNEEKGRGKAGETGTSSPTPSHASAVTLLYSDPSTSLQDPHYPEMGKTPAIQKVHPVEEEKCIPVASDGSSSRPPRGLALSIGSSVVTSASFTLPRRTQNDLSSRLASLAKGSGYAARAAKGKAEMEEGQGSTGSTDAHSSAMPGNTFATSTKGTTSSASAASLLLANRTPSSQSASSASTRPSTTSSVLTRSTQFLTALKSNRLATVNGKASQGGEKKKETG